MTPASSPACAPLVSVRGTELLPGDSREQYRQKIARITLDSMVQFVGLLDAEGTVLEINQVALTAVGITLDEVEGRPFWTTFWWQVSPEVNATLRDCIRRAAGGEFVRWDAEIYGRAGGKETIIIDASLTPVKDEQGRVVFITAEGRDITEKKTHERETAAAIRRSEARYRSIFETTDAGVALSDPAGIWVDVNPALCRMLGRSRNELVGRLHPELVPAEGQEMVMEARRAIEAGQCWRGEMPLRHADGRTRIFEWQVTKLPDEEIRLAVAVDVTSRREIEEELRERADEMSVFNRVATGRELRMVELKREINTLCLSMGYPPRYPVDVGLEKHA